MNLVNIFNTNLIITIGFCAFSAFSFKAHSDASSIFQEIVGAQFQDNETSTVHEWVYDFLLAIEDNDEELLRERLMELEECDDHNREVLIIAGMKLALQLHRMDLIEILMETGIKPTATPKRFSLTKAEECNLTKLRNAEKKKMASPSIWSYVKPVLLTAALVGFFFALPVAAAIQIPQTNQTSCIDLPYNLTGKVAECRNTIERAATNLATLRQITTGAALSSPNSQDFEKALEDLKASNNPLESQAILARLAGFVIGRNVPKTCDVAAREPIHIVAAFDENYVPHAAATLASTIISHLSGCARLNFHILEEPGKGLSLQTKVKLQEMVKSLSNENAHIAFSTFDESLISDGVMKLYSNSTSSPTPHWPLSIMYKVYIPQVFATLFSKDGRSKVMWLDTDTVVLDDLTKIWMEKYHSNHTIAGAIDPAQNNTERMKPLGLAASDAYINVGVVGFNPALNVTDYFNLIEKWAASGREAPFPEQDLLSASQAGRIKILGAHWNQFGYMISKSDWDQYADLPSIIHYAGDKPWKLSSPNTWSTDPRNYKNFEALYWVFRAIAGFPLEPQTGNIRLNNNETVTGAMDKH